MQNTLLSGTINNAIITLGNIDDSGKGRHFISRFIKDGLVKIEGHGVVLLKKETLDASLPSMIGTPVIIRHQDVTKKNADKLRCGTIANAYFNEPDGWYYCEGIIWDEDAQELIENQGWSVSCSYDFLSYNDEGGVENNIPYDKEFTQLNFTHLAIVDNPRYERANIVFNSKDENGRWVTIKGTHVFIPDGKSVDEVMKEKGWGDKKNKQSDVNSKENLIRKALLHGEPEGTQVEFKVTKPFSTHGYINKANETNVEYWLYDKDGKQTQGTRSTTLTDEFLESFKDQQSDTKGGKSGNQRESNTTKDTRRHIDRIEKLIKKYNLEPHEEDELLDELGSFEAKLDENLEPREEEELREELFDFEDDIKRHQEMKKQESKQSDTKDKHGFKKDKDSGYYMKDLSDGTSVYVEKKEGGQGEKEPFYLEATHFDKDGKTIDKKQYHYDSMDGMFGKIDKDFVSKDKQSDSKDKQNPDDEYKYNAKQLTYGKQYLPKNYQGPVLTFIGEDNGKAYFREGYDAFNREAKKVSFEDGTKFASHETGSNLGKGVNPLPSYMLSSGSESNRQRIQYIKEHGKPSEYENRDINNSKEQDMTLLNEIKKLISKVENSKENEMEIDEKIENEAVDKRKLIDEVAGIMKSAGCDDEVIRTAIGKMEKIGYDKSEAGSADNKKVKNEGDKDEKEAKDLKDDLKKDVDNKCKNSKEESTFDKINAIYNSIKLVKEESKYTSRQEKLDAAKEYFS